MPCGFVYKVKSVKAQNGLCMVHVASQAFWQLSLALRDSMILSGRINHGWSMKYAEIQHMKQNSVHAVQTTAVALHLFLVVTIVTKYGLEYLLACSLPLESIIPASVYDRSLGLDNFSRW